MITILSYNVMFNDIHLKERHNELVQLVKKFSPDVICLQEVLASYVDFFLDHFTNYTPVFETLMPKKREYGELILVRHDWTISHKECLPLTSIMGRSLLHCEISNGVKIYNVVTFHLESMHIKEFREEQLKTMWKVYGGLPNAIFCGDTNLTESESDGLPKGISDLWKVIGGPKSTYFGNRFWGKKNAERYDRVFFKDLEAFSFRTIGYNPFEIGGKDVWISDHDGIIAQFI